MQAARSSIIGRWLAPALLMIFVGFALAFLSPFRLNQLTLVASYCIALIGLNIVVGLAGQISLAHGAFFAIGAYGTAILVAKAGLTFPVALLGAGLVTMATGFATGLPALRLKGHYLAVATLALSVAVPPIANRWASLTGGSSGLDMGQIVVPGWLPLGHDAYLFAWAIGIAALAMAGANRLAASPYGTSLIAIRENEVAAVAMGTNLANSKVSAFAVSALLAGIGGGIFAQSVGFVAPENFAPVLSLMFLAGLVIGGTGSFYGTIVGALFLRFIPDYAADIDRYLAGILFGVAIILFLRVMPNGPYLAIIHASQRMRNLRDSAGKNSTRNAEKVVNINNGGNT